MSTRKEGPALHFVAVTYGNEDRRQFELRDAAAKSHAARVSYPWKTKPLVLKKKPTRRRRNAKRKDPNMCAPAKCPLSNNSSLDPFVRLKVDLHLKERHLVHEYLTEVPKALYGTTTRAAFCPVRALTFEGIAQNEIWLGWVLFLARYRQLVLSGRSPACDPDLLHYRSSTYRLLRREVADLDPNTSLDDVFQGLLTAGIAEDRIGESANAQCHLEAGLKMVVMMRERGIQTPRFSGTGLIICGSYIAVGVLNYFKTSRQLLAAGRSLLQRLRSMAVRNPVPRCKSLKSRAVTDSSPTRDRYLNLRRAICRANSVLRRNICEQTHRTSTNDVRTRLAALFAVNLVIQTSRGEEAIAIGFLEELIDYLSNSTTRTPNGPPTQLSPTGVMYIVSFCGSNLAKRYGSYYFDIWDVVDALEFIMLAEPETRSKLGKVMESWLFADTASATFDDKDEWTMIKEVNATWLARRAQLTGTVASSGKD